jgi:hypothetical protein
MSIKKQLLGALDCTLDDLSETRLLDLLLDAYQAQKKEIERLHGVNAREAQRLRDDLECVRRDRERIQRDPLYCAHGEYFFLVNGRRIGVSIQGSHIDLYERGANKINYAGQRLSATEWSNA